MTNTETTSRYCCKTCGAESPAGIGYAVSAAYVAPAAAANCAGPHASGQREPIQFAAVATVERFEIAGHAFVDVTDAEGNGYTASADAPVEVV